MPNIGEEPEVKPANNNATIGLLNLQHLSDTFFSLADVMMRNMVHVTLLKTSE